MRDKGSKLLLRKSSAGSILSWFPALFFLANIYRMTRHSYIPYMVMLIVSGIVGLFVALFVKNTRKDVVSFLLAVIVIFGLFNNLTVGNSDLTEIGSSCLFIGITVLMFLYPLTYARGVVIFYLSIATFLFGYLTKASVYNFLTSSSNYISVLLILAASFYYITIYSSEHVFTFADLLPALLCFLISVWARGRGGILSAVILLSFLILYFARNVANKNTRRMLFVVLIGIVAVAYIVFWNVNLLERFMRLGKWAYRGTENVARLRIWGAYFSKVRERLMYLLLGAPLSDIPIIYGYNNNTHNSFMQLHANYGLITFGLFVVLLIKAFVYQIRKKQYLLSIVMFTLLVRGMSDKFIFGQYGMPIMMYLVLEPYFDRHIHAKSAFTEHSQME